MKRATRKRPTVGERIIEGLERAVAWTRGENDRVRVTVVQAAVIANHPEAVEDVPAKAS